MNLMKSFNRDYMIQNIKKSKSVLAFFLGIIPIISLLFFIILIHDADYEIVNLETISIIHFFGIYFIPIILSFCLFGFVYKKKSIDFIGSMPISRKGIFLSNTIGGILLILAMVLLCAFGIYFIGLFSGFILPFRMISDYVLLWSVTYIFVFIISNIAMSVSGNVSTQIVVTLLLLFFVPYLVDYICDLSSLTYFQPSYSTICLEGSEFCHGGYRVITTNYTVPYNNLHMLFDGNFQVWNVISIIKMIVFSIIGYFIGYFFYFKRKMEVCGTSFKNLKTHNIMKAFTMVPIIFLIVELVPDFDLNSHVSFLLVICILVGLLIYYFIYDLITRKTITNIRTSLKHFCVTLVVLFGVGYAFGHVFTGNSHTIYVHDNDIISYQIPTSNRILGDIHYVTVKDKKIISFLTQELKRNNIWEEGDRYLEIKMILNKISYKISVSIPSNTYDELYKMIEDAKNDDVTLADGLFDSNRVFALGVSLESTSRRTVNTKLIREAKKVVKNQNDCDANKKFYVPISLYAYQDGRVVSYRIASCTNEYLDDYAVSSVQKENERLYQNIYDKYINDNFGIWIENCPDDIQSLGINIDSYMSDYKAKVLSFIKKHHKDTFSSSKDYLSLTIHLDGKYYVYYTNKIEEFMNVLNISEDSYHDTH